MRIVTTVKEEVTEVRERVVSDVVTCDICGVVSKAKQPVSGIDDDAIDWTGQDYSGYAEFDVTRVVRKTGWRSPEGGADKTTEYHVCPACWPKLAMWIESHRGATPTASEDKWW